MEKKFSVYLETSMVSYLTGRLSKDLTTLFRQQVTREWWEVERNQYDLFISRFVIQEVAKGDPRLSQDRLNLLKNIPKLPYDDSIEKTAQEYIDILHLPPQALLDAAHLAIASHHQIDFILTWNLTHIANRIFVRKYEEKNRELGLFSPVVCTPEDLLHFIGDSYD